MEKTFIKMSDESCSFEKYAPAPYFRKTFELDFVPEKAEISICGLGFYRIFINGEEITKGALAPYISNPDHLCYYDTYDVKPHLCRGKNAIGILLGNGFYNNFGGAVWDFDKAHWVGAPRLALEFEASGIADSFTFSADDSFKAHPSPIYFDDLRMGVYYDANLEIDNWCNADFDDSKWQNAAFAKAPRGKMVYCEAEPVTIYREKKPLSVTKCGDGYLYDFGENNAGVCRLSLSDAIKGQKISLVHGEVLKDGKLFMDDLGFPQCDFYGEYNQKDIYIAKGEKSEEFIPCFTYHGFRYVYVEGISESQATPDLLTYLIMSSALKDIGNFNCSDETANKLYAMTKRSDISNFYYFPTDCPHREKNGWTGDAALSADHMILNFDTEKSWRVWLENIRASQINGQIPCIVPTGDWGYTWGNGPAWDSVLFRLPYQIWKTRGNTDVIYENAHAFIAYLDYILSRRNPDGTVSFGLGDWVPVGKKRAVEYDSPLVLTDTLFAMDNAKKAAEMLGAIGYTPQAEFAESIRKDFLKIIRETMIDYSTMTALGACQTSQALFLYYNIFTEEEKPEAYKKLVELVHAKNDSFDCGFLGMHVIFHVLSDCGESELAYNMITKKDYPSYGHLIELGETTLVEKFQPDGVSCGSHNHHFMGDISRWFIERVAGLRIIDSKTVRIAPEFIPQITSAYAHYELPDGIVSVKWQRTENGTSFEIECPQSVECDLSCIQNQNNYIKGADIIKKHVITDYGVKKDTDTFQTTQIQAVLDLCKTDGGIVVIPEGTYHIASIRLWSNTTLYLEKGAKLLGSKNCNNYEDFSVPEDFVFYTDSEAFSYRHPERPIRPAYRHAMISAFGEENISIIGEEGSFIDGCDCFDPDGEEGFRGPHGIFLSSCKNVTLKGYTIQNSGNFMHQLDNCENVVMENVTALAGHDGIHLHCCKHMKITNCTFTTGDDCIAGANVLDVTVSGCNLNSSCNNFRIGGIDILVENCTAKGPGYYPHLMTVVKDINSSFNRTDGRHNTLYFLDYFASENFANPTPSNITVKNCKVENVDGLFYYDVNHPTSLHSGMALSEVVFENVTATGLVKPSTAYATENTPLNIKLKDVTMQFADEEITVPFKTEFTSISE